MGPRRSCACCISRELCRDCRINVSLRLGFSDELYLYFLSKNNYIPSRFKWQNGILPISSQGLYPTFTTNLSRGHRARTQGVSVSVGQDKSKSCMSASSSSLHLNSNFVSAMLSNLPIDIYTPSNWGYRPLGGECYTNPKFWYLLVSLIYIYVCV